MRILLIYFEPISIVLGCFIVYFIFKKLLLKISDLLGIEEDY
jgi:hypothetical protein